jgi:phage/plasmid-like protein (TIGR03299 family)
MAHEIESIAYANQTPWHGLGVKVDASISIDEMLVKAGLNWRVEHKPLFARIAEDASQDVRVKGTFALVRDKDSRIMTLSSKAWTPVQNAEMMEFFRDYAEAGGAKLETAGSLRGGRQVWALADLGTGFKIGNADNVRGYLLFNSSHEVGKATRIKVVATRVVCANTIALAMREQGPTYSQNHLKAFDPEAAKAYIQEAHEQVAAFGREARLLAKIKINAEKTVQVLMETLNGMPEGLTEPQMMQEEHQPATLKAILHAIEKAPGAVPGTAWGVLNGVTYWADHMSGKTQEGRLASAWGGANGETKLRVKDALLAI